MPQTQKFYVKEGAISLVPDTTITYTSCFPMLSCAMNHGVQIDGKVRGKPYPVSKDGTHFFIQDAANDDWNAFASYSWNANATTPRYERDSTYTYIYTPKEMDYK